MKVTDEDVRRAEEAAYILQGQVLPEAFAGLESRIVEGWKEGRSAAERETLHIKLHLLRELRAEIMTPIARAAKHERDHAQDGPFRAIFQRLVRK